jgi:hypothetical protein
MLKKIITAAAWILSVFWCYAQDSVPMVKYTQDFKFQDGVFINFGEWKSNRPRLTNFQVVRTNSFGAQDDVELRYSCSDDNGTVNTCIVKNCFAYTKNGALYIAQGYYGYYYRAFIIGSLTHFIAFTGFDARQDYYYIDPNSLLGSENDFREYLLDFETGNTFVFSYKTFAAFLKERDTDLYQQLMDSKRKRKMIHHFLLKYNEKHPIYFPAS